VEKNRVTLNATIWPAVTGMVTEVLPLRSWLIATFPAASAMKAMQGYLRSLESERHPTVPSYRRAASPGLRLETRNAAVLDMVIKTPLG